MKNIVFFGTRNIGYLCLINLYDRKDELNINIIGVLTSQKEKDIIKYCKLNKIKLIQSLDEYLALDVVDIGISVQFEKILKEIHINKAKDIIVNFHMAPLPEYRGCNQFAFAIADNAKVFGITIHRIEKGIDSGDIIFENRFLIPKNC